MNLRVSGLVAAVVCTALLPLAATAGPLPGGGAGSGAATGAGAGVGARTGIEPGAGSHAVIASPVSGIEGAEPVDTAVAVREAVDAVVPTAERCGPEIASPDGIEAQACVLTDGRETWARVYYRNATGGELRAVLSLMGPRGRTVQTSCAADATGEPAVCETPRERPGTPRGTSGRDGDDMRGRGREAEHHTAMTEFAATAKSGNGGGETGPLLLRAGSSGPLEG
ncbi:hypothetical protein ACWCXE_02235 [Streptomyces sp. NPDC001780]